MIFVVSFSFAFFLLLRDPRHEDINNEFSSYATSVLTVYGMVFGAFELDWFHQAPYAKKIAVGLFMIFMIVLPTVMFNALIALVRPIPHAQVCHQSSILMMVQQFNNQINYVAGCV
eukprot:COSAG01_NODE_2827_length_7003_cov_127.679316_5_plen_116_part_00